MARWSSPQIILLILSFASATLLHDRTFYTRPHNREGRWLPTSLDKTRKGSLPQTGRVQSTSTTLFSHSPVFKVPLRWAVALLLANPANQLCAWVRSCLVGENAELLVDLNSEYRDRRKDAVKRVIANMTVGKDVSSLFPHVVKNMQTEDLEMVRGNGRRATDVSWLVSSCHRITIVHLKTKACFLSPIRSLEKTGVPLSDELCKIQPGPRHSCGQYIRQSKLIALHSQSKSLKKRIYSTTKKRWKGYSRLTSPL